MKFSTIAVAAAISAVSSLAQASGLEELCGSITQEVEGTWLEVAIDARDPNTSYAVNVLEGGGAEELEQGAEVCVEVAPAGHDERGRPVWQVLSIRPN
jgi:hypothetical protein